MQPARRFWCAKPQAGLAISDHQSRSWSAPFAGITQTGSAGVISAHVRRAPRMFRTFQVNRLSSSSMARRTGRPGSLRLRYRPLEYAFGESHAPSTVRRTSPKLRKRASEAEAKLKRLYDAIENGIIDVSDPTLMERVTELKAIRD